MHTPISCKTMTKKNNIMTITLILVQFLRGVSSFIGKNCLFAQHQKLCQNFSHSHRAVPRFMSRRWPLHKGKRPARSLGNDFENQKHKPCMWKSKEECLILEWPSGHIQTLEYLVLGVLSSLNSGGLPWNWFRVGQPGAFSRYVFLLAGRRRPHPESKAIKVTLFT